MVHVLFNVIGVLVWLPLIWLLVEIAVWVSPSSPGLEGSARAASEVPRQIANANTLFNVINTVVFIGFAASFARMAEWLVRERAPTEGVIIEPEFLHEAALKVPSVALQQVRLELGRVGAIAIEMMRDVVPAIEDRDLTRLNNIARRDDEVDILEEEILKYLGTIQKGTLTDEESLEYRGLMMAADNLESLADVIETDVISLARKAAEITIDGSEETKAMLTELHATALEAVERAVRAVRDKDQREAEAVQIMKDAIRDQAERLLERKAARLKADDPEYLALIRLEMGFVDQMRRIYTLAKRIAKDQLPPVLAHRE
jgi:phosphate:Na+ symporter